MPDRKPPPASASGSLEAIAAAESLAGLSLDDVQRADVADRLAALRSIYDDLRSRPLPNGLGPAVHFTPTLPEETREGVGEDVDAPASPARTSWQVDAAGAGPLPGDDLDIVFASLGELAGWLRRGELTSARLTDLYLERLARIDPELRCVVTLTEERARAGAARADEELRAGLDRGPLHGIPWGAKDLLDTRGIATTFGSPLFRDRVPDADAEVVRRLDEAGAVLVAKLSLGELAQGDRWFGGQTRNPWNVAQGSGGSSAGSGAAVAAGGVGFALGSETLGSITDPSATCGVVGLRPTFGRVPRSGALALSWSLDKIGPMTRSASDAARVLAAIHGSHPGDPDAVDRPFDPDPRGVEDMRVGWVPGQFESAGVGDAERGALRVLRDLGAELREVQLPRMPLGVSFLILAAESGAAFQELTLSGRDTELCNQEAGDWPSLFRAAHLVSAVEYVQAQRQRSRISQQMAEVMRDLDALVAPGMGHVLVDVTNATGHPSLTLPVGFRDEQPLAVTLHGRLYGEATLCRLAQAMEERLDARGRRPPVGQTRDG